MAPPSPSSGDSCEKPIIEADPETRVQARLSVSSRERIVRGGQWPAAIGIVLSLVTAELVCRAFYFEKQTFDPNFGYIFAPGTKVIYAREGHGISSWWQSGVRRSKPLTEAAEGKILVLGDSFTEALQIDDGDVYTDLLEAHLQESGYPLAVLNLGRSGTSIADYIDKAPKYAESFAPRWVVIQVRDSDFTEEAWTPRAGFAAFEQPEGGMLTVVPGVHRPPGTSRKWANAVLNASALARFSLVRQQEFRNWFDTEAPLFQTQMEPAPPAKTPGCSQLSHRGRTRDARQSI